MKRTPATIGLALVFTAAFPVAALSQEEDATQIVIENSDRLLVVEDWWVPAAPSIQGRKDVQVISLPPPPSGPANQQPLCTPANPNCP